MIAGLSNLDERTVEDLTARRYTLKQISHGSVILVEKKDDMKGRLGRSPDFGDSYCGWAELLCRLGYMPGMLSSPVNGKKWESNKKRARKASIRFSEKGEFSHFSL
jgi:hypothetical protein